jgi:parallel beta-helix repeat protein
LVTSFYKYSSFFIFMSYKKGQQATELIATYGWAILLMFIAIAFLFGSGFFNYSRFELDDCTIQPNLPCERYYVQTVSSNEARVAFDVRNKMGFPIYIQDYSAEFEGQATLCGGSADSHCSYYLPNGEDARLIVDFETQRELTESDFAKIYLNIDFVPCNGLDASQCILESESRDVLSTSGRVFTYPRATPGIYLTPPPDDKDPGDGEGPGDGEDPGDGEGPGDGEDPDDIENMYCVDDTHYAQCVNDACELKECFGQYCCPSTDGCAECLPSQTRCSLDGLSIQTCSLDCNFGNAPCANGEICQEIGGVATCVPTCAPEQLCLDENDEQTYVCCEEPMACTAKGDMEVCTSNEEEIDSCMDLTEAGKTYKLDSNLFVDADSFSDCCIIVKADDITIDGQGHKISLNGDLKYHKAICSAKENTQITDLTIKKFHTAMMLDGSTNAHVYDVVTDQITDIALKAYSSQLINVHDNNLKSDEDGINMRGAVDVTIDKNTVSSGSQAGIRVSGGAQNVLITNNNAHAKKELGNHSKWRKYRG